MKLRYAGRAMRQEAQQATQPTGLPVTQPVTQPLTQAATRATGLHWVMAVAIAVAVSGCATTPGENSNKQSELIAQKLDSYIVEEGTVRHDITNPDVARLWKEYSVIRDSGNLTAAKGKLQEAIALSPNDAGLWSSAAELELEEQSHLRAENFAAKSNLLVGTGNRQLRFRNWLIIERAREGRGDLLGAREAQIESAKLQ